MVEQLGEVGQGLVISIREHDHVDFLEAGGHLGHVHPLEQEAMDHSLRALLLPPATLAGPLETSHQREVGEALGPAGFQEVVGDCCRYGLLEDMVFHCVGWN